LSKRAARLIREAVSKPTVLPTTYAILENPGDRISRLSAPKPTPTNSRAHFQTSRSDSDPPQTTPVEATAVEQATDAPIQNAPTSPKETESVAPQTEDTPKPEIIEPAPVAVETVTPPQKKDETEATSPQSTPTVTCPQCQSSDIRENGHRQGKQRYRCQNCGRHFAIPEVDEVEEKPKLPKNTHPKRASTPPPPTTTASSDRLFNATKRRSKKKTKARGFGSSKSGD
jgi:ssDNA-binding Zn-finger/Zn-ribbon topoisomerase 1